jgi:aminomethyltransferase
MVCRKVSDLAPGRGRYGLTLAADGTVEDDLLVLRLSADAFRVVVNAGNLPKILSLWRAALSAGTTLTDESAALAMIAVQGPQALAGLAALGLDGRDLKPYGVADQSWNGIPVRVSRTGYTGEDGAELEVPAAHAAALWSAVLAAGCAPCGLGCRDTLRMEAAMPLYGHELDRSATPVEAGLGWAVNPAGGFIGAERCLAQLASGPERRMVGLRMAEKRVPRQGYAVLANGVAVGAITSGTLSPTLGYALGMAYVPAAHAALGTALTVDLRGVQMAATVVAMPFYKRAR